MKPEVRNVHKATLTQIVLALSILLLIVSRPAGAAPVRLEERISGHALRFDLPTGYRALEAIDGGIVIYHESTPGFLVLYRVGEPPEETLSNLLARTANVRRNETPLQVDVGGLGGPTFNGLFVETAGGSRLFLAAAEDWGLVAQGATADWPSLASGFNQVLRTLTFEEDR